MHRVLFILALLAITANAYAADVKLSVVEVKDQRTTGDFFNNLEIKIKLLGDDAPSVRGVHTIIRTAVDDTGRSLLLDDEKKDEFESLSDSRHSTADVTLKFRNPARKAALVREISGELHLFMPEKDPSATLLIKGFMKTLGKPIQNTALTKANISLTVLTKKEYEVLKKAEEKKAKETALKQGATEAVIAAFEGLFSGFFHVGENDVLLKISDPSKNLIDLDIIDARGAKIKGRGTMKSRELNVLNYSEPLPEDAKLRLFLKTKKSVASVPLRLVDIVLP